MKDDPYFESSPDALTTQLAALRARGHDSLSGLAPWLRELDPDRPASSSAADWLDLLAREPLPYIPELNPAPADVWRASVRGLHLLVCLADSLQALNDSTALELIRAIYAHAEFLYCFNVSRSPAVRAINGAFLAMAGFYLSALPVAEPWRLVGMLRLVSNLQPAASALDEPAIQAMLDLQGSGWLAQFPHLHDEPLGALASEIILWVTQRAQQDNRPLVRAWAEYYHELTGHTLEHHQWTGLRLLGSRSNDPSTALRAYLSRYYRDTYFIGRATSADLSERPIDLHEADEICNNTFTLRIHMHRRHQFTDEIDWTLILDDDLESNVSLNWHYHAHVLALAFHQTRNEKYLTHLIRLLR